jgi:hypothetical protein
MCSTYGFVVEEGKEHFNISQDAKQKTFNNILELFSKLFLNTHHTPSSILPQTSSPIVPMKPKECHSTCHMAPANV